MPPSKIMGTVFWDAEGGILIEFLEHGKTINASHYAQTLSKPRLAMRDKRPERKVTITLVLTPLLWPWKKIEKMGWEVHPQTSGVLTWHTQITISGFVNNQMRSHHYGMRGTPDSCASMSSGSRYGVLRQGNIQTSRTVGKMRTEKRDYVEK